MKKIKIAILLFLLWNGYYRACDACELQQPKITRGFTHGVGPESNWDWLIVGIITFITLATLFYSFKFLLKSQEKNKEHIKNTVLNF